MSGTVQQDPYRLLSRWDSWDFGLRTSRFRHPVSEDRSIEVFNKDEFEPLKPQPPRPWLGTGLPLRRRAGQKSIAEPLYLTFFGAVALE